MTDFDALPDDEIRALAKHRWNEISRIGTHSAECWTFGPRHYDCALAKVRDLRNKIERQAAHINAQHAAIMKLKNG